jgi:hypothetical protein
MDAHTETLCGRCANHRSQLDTCGLCRHRCCPYTSIGALLMIECGEVASIVILIKLPPLQLR